MNELEQVTIARLEERRHKLAAHLAEQESELKDTGQRLAGIDETIIRLRQRAARQTKTTN